MLDQLVYFVSSLPFGVQVGIVVVGLLMAASHVVKPSKDSGYDHHPRRRG